MKRKSRISFLICLLIISSGLVFAKEPTTNWQYFKSCIDFSNHLNKIIKNKNLTLSPTLKLDFRGEKPSLSSQYLSILNGSNLFILDKPSFTKTLQQSKVIARIYLPQHKESIQHAILSNNLLLIAIPYKQSYQVLLYQIQNHKLKIVKNLFFSSPLLAIRSTDEKLIFITETSFQTKDFKRFLKEQKPENLTQILLAKDLIASSGEVISPSCKQIQHLDTTPNLIPHLMSFHIFDINEPEKIPENTYYFGTINQIYVDQDYIFTTQNLNNPILDCEKCIIVSTGNSLSLLQRHSLSPQLYHTESALLTGEVLYFFGEAPNKPILLKALSSGKLKKYLLTSFDGLFRALQNEKIITTTKELYNTLLSSKSASYLSYDGKTMLSINTPQSSSFKINSKSDFWYQNVPDTKLLRTQVDAGEIKIALYGLSSSGESLIGGDVIPYPSPQNFIRDSTNQMLVFASNDKNKRQIHGYFISSKGKAQHRFTRTYEKLSVNPTLKNILIFEAGGSVWTIVLFEEYLDIFSNTKPSNTKLVKIK